MLTSPRLSILNAELPPNDGESGAGDDGDGQDDGRERSHTNGLGAGTKGQRAMVASYKRLTLKAACGFLLCIMGLLTSGNAMAQNTIRRLPPNRVQLQDRGKTPQDRLHRHNWTAA